VSQAMMAKTKEKINHLSQTSKCRSKHNQGLGTNFHCLHPNLCYCAEPTSKSFLYFHSLMVSRSF
jgi:hypothetical protein